VSSAIGTSSDMIVALYCKRPIPAGFDLRRYGSTDDGGTLNMIPIGSHPLWHPVFETLGYAAGYAVFRRLRARRGDAAMEPQQWSVLAAAVVGALIGSRLLELAEQWPTVLDAWQSGRMLALLFAPGGKTIAGGLLGGWLGAEIVQRMSGTRRWMGDLLALPLCVGIAVGRIGCLLAGLADDTYGSPTSLPWAANFGDGIGRHPVQVYEILFLALVGILVSAKVNLPEGARFRLFFASYLAWRTAIDFLKPEPQIHGLNLIQWPCLAGVLLLVSDWAFSRKGNREQTSA
jgi:prolipoprotein diacylglyceryltransferase